MPVVDEDGPGWGHPCHLDTFLVLYFLYNGIYCGYSFELHLLVNAIQMNTHNICLYKENQKKSNYHHQINPILIFYSVPLVGRFIFYHS